jgi:hypothetical protein
MNRGFTSDTAVLVSHAPQTSKRGSSKALPQEARLTKLRKSARNGLRQHCCGHADRSWTSLARIVHRRSNVGVGSTNDSQFDAKQRVWDLHMPLPLTNTRAVPRRSVEAPKPGTPPPPPRRHHSPVSLSDVRAAGPSISTPPPLPASASPSAPPSSAGALNDAPRVVPAAAAPLAAPPLAAPALPTAEWMSNPILFHRRLRRSTRFRSPLALRNSLRWVIHWLVRCLCSSWTKARVWVFERGGWFPTGRERRTSALVAVLAFAFGWSFGAKPWHSLHPQRRGAAQTATSQVPLAPPRATRSAVGAVSMAAQVRAPRVTKDAEPELRAKVKSHGMQRGTPAQRRGRPLTPTKYKRH